MTEPTPVWATPAEISAWLGVSVRTLAEWRKCKRGPRFVHEGRTIRYLWSDVYAWANARRKASVQA